MDARKDGLLVMTTYNRCCPRHCAAVITAGLMVSCIPGCPLVNSDEKPAVDPPLSCAEAGLSCEDDRDCCDGLSCSERGWCTEHEDDLPPAPDVPASPDPVDGASNVSIEDRVGGLCVFLDWAISDATSYDVYLQEDFVWETSGRGMSWSSGGGSDIWLCSMGHSRTYLWQVVATNAAGTTEGPVWSFTTEQDPGGVETLQVNAGPNFTIDPEMCISLDGSFTGGQAPYTYAWTAPGWSIPEQETEAIVCPEETTTFIFTVRDSSPGINQVSDQTTVTVRQPPPPDKLLDGAHTFTLDASEAKRYALLMERGETAIVNASMPDRETDIDIYSYEPDRDYPFADSANDAGRPENVTFTANTSGEYAIELVNMSSLRSAEFTLGPN